MLHRRLARDYEALPIRFEALPTRSGAVIRLAMTDLMACRLSGGTTVPWRDPTPQDETQSPKPQIVLGQHVAPCRRGSSATAPER
ncbi:hypothetical protein OG978_39295 [Streptomyces sp. NBC_01591]|nr:hypothetical protein OG978_39295 [Streptomyces sp. NBC_01591]